MVTYTRCGDSIFVFGEDGAYSEILELGKTYSIIGNYDVSKLLGGRRGILDGIFDLEKDEKDHHKAALYKGAAEAYRN
jgi:hypothetical protein